ncbi:GRIN2-like protein [Larimichthys crocea]|uniref:GRIN2-like protein n=1 Tax=Larimichthys crocea TaxID=215358 RepID=A0A6G0HYB6_LARCR|nr:GRIN2-like protein [Larimichthys crocea]
MSRPRRPASESYQPACHSSSQSVSFSSEAGTTGLEDEDDGAPIFSLSKSSMDVVMATGPPHKRDPTWTRLDLRRSSSTNTHSAEQNSLTVMWQHISATNSHQLSLAAQNVEVESPPALSERWVTNVQRWSECSGSTQSGRSTPETIIWKDGTSRPFSLTQDTPYSSALGSPMSRPTSPPTTPSPFISPLQTPTLPPEDPLTSSSSLLKLSTHQPKDSSPTSSPLLSPQQAPTSSPLPSNSSSLLHLASTVDEGFLENNLLSLTIPSSVIIAEGCASSDPGGLADDVTEELHSPDGTQLSEDGGLRSPVRILSSLVPNSPAKVQDSGVCHLELPGQSCLTGRGSPLVSSLSDSLLGECCRCNLNTREGITKTPKVEVCSREEGTMTSQPDLVDVAVQTTSPMGSLWGLRKDLSTSNMGSHSILGSPPGSKLNLKSSVGSNSNLVSPSSSMFPVSSGDEEERRGAQTWNSASSHYLDRRRSCLKIQGEERDMMGRRSSMKQVQWDEEGMTWDVHGASLDPEDLNTAIRKHLLHQSSPRPQRRSSKKKKAPKPPLISNVVKAKTPEPNPPVMIVTSTCLVESKGTPDVGRKAEEEGRIKKEETVEAVRISRAEGEHAKEEDEVYGEEGTSQPRSPSHESAHSCKRSVIRSLRRPGWCGGCRKVDG